MTSEPLDRARSAAISRSAWLGAREVIFDDWVSYEIEAMTESRSATGSRGSGILPILSITDETGLGATVGSDSTARFSTEAGGGRSIYRHTPLSRRYRYRLVRGSPTGFLFVKPLLSPTRERI
eukprot:scaffold12244_cov216-Isochrysis_galbana.AAC.4